MEVQQLEVLPLKLAGEIYWLGRWYKEWKSFRDASFMYMIVIA